jgi:hypothetical protein
LYLPVDEHATTVTVGPAQAPEGGNPRRVGNGLLVDTRSLCRRTTDPSESEKPAQREGFREYRHGDSNVREWDDKAR